jgi:hypothetical protein
MTFSVTPAFAAQRPATTKTGVLVTGGPLGLFTVSGGRVQLYSLFAEVTTVVGAGATSLVVQGNPTTGVDTAFCTAGVITAAPVGSYFGLTGAFAGALQVLLATQGALQGMTTPIVVAPGSIDLVITGGTTGACTWRCLWDPIDAGALLVAA